VPEAVRGTVLGLNVSFASVGWIAAAAVGGWLIAGSGFGSLGLFCAGSALVGTIVLGVGGLIGSRGLTPRPRDGSAPATAGS
jgi:MFS transporter, DHA1 family, inner membrane transport protein